MIYKTQDQLMPKNLIGISNTQIEDHWSLYKGYVNQVNKLNEELAFLRKESKTDSLMFADRRRRLGFEYNGMVLHEYYFANLKAGEENAAKNTDLYKAIEESFGSYDTWKLDFESAGKTRGIGWAILYADNQNGALTNHFIAEHENGNIAGFSPILVMDVWEHAYMVDHKSGGRANYIAAFMKNIQWEVVENRFKNVTKHQTTKRF